MKSFTGNLEQQNAWISLWYYEFSTSFSMLSRFATSSLCSQLSITYSEVTGNNFKSRTISNYIFSRIRVRKRVFPAFFLELHRCSSTRERAGDTTTAAACKVLTRGLQWQCRLHSVFWAAVFCRSPLSVFIAVTFDLFMNFIYFFLSSFSSSFFITKCVFPLPHLMTRQHAESQLFETGGVTVAFLFSAVDSKINLIWWPCLRQLICIY